MANIFISYGRKDAKTLALQLRNDLSTVGYSVWLDLDEIPSGGSFTQDLERAIDGCDVMLVLLSHSGVASVWCRGEQMRAIRKGKSIVPLLVQPDAEPPIYLEHLNYLDFSLQERYDDGFRNLISDLTSSMAFRMAQEERRVPASTKSTQKLFKKPAISKSDRTYSAERRNAGAFRRHIKALRLQQWMGGRFWWSYFAFMLLDLHDVVDILEKNELLAPYLRHQQHNSRWDRMIRMQFRPRTPYSYNAEGFKFANDPKTVAYAPLPIYLLFDLESVLLQPNVKFSDGDVNEGASTYSTPQTFGELPFELIYHDSWLKSDEMEEVLRYRKSELLIPERMGLEGLQVIWTRSEADYETLHQIMNARSPHLWRKWRDKITPRTDFILFHNKRAFVHSATLGEKEARLRFNSTQSDNMGQAFMAEVAVHYTDGRDFHWQYEQFKAQGELVLQLPHEGKYSLTLLLDGDLAYTGEYKETLRVL